MSEGGNPVGPGNPYGRGYTQPLAVPPTVDQYPPVPQPGTAPGANPLPISPVAPPAPPGAPVTHAPYAAPGPHVLQASVPRPAKSKLLWILLGIGATLFVIVLAVGGYAAYLVKRQFDGLEVQLDEARRNVGAQPLSGNCKLAYDCCLRITQSASDAVLAAQCENFRSPGHTDTECSAALAGYGKVALTRGLRCD